MNPGIMGSIFARFVSILRHPIVGFLGGAKPERSLDVCLDAATSSYVPPVELTQAIADESPQDILARARGGDFVSPQGCAEAGYLYSLAHEKLRGISEEARDESYYRRLWEAVSGEIRYAPNIASDAHVLHRALGGVAEHGAIGAPTPVDIALMKAHLVYRAGGDLQKCLHLYDDIVHDARIEEALPDVYRLGWEAHRARINIYMQWGTDCRRPEDRARAWDIAAHGALDELEHYTERAPDDVRASYRAEMRFMYSHLVARLFAAGHTRYAHEIYTTLRTKHPGSPEHIAARKTLSSILDDDGQLITPTVSQRVGAAIKQLSVSAKFPSIGAAFGWMMGGAVFGSVVTDAVTGGSAGTSTLMQGAAVGTVSAYAAGKITHASNDRPFADAWATGHTNVTTGQAAREALMEAMKLGLLYVLWGGEAIPSDVAARLPLIADASGQFAQISGLGSIEVFFHEVVTEHGFDLVRLVAQDPSNGFSQWWTGLLDKKIAFAQVVQMGMENWARFFSRNRRAWGTSPSENPVLFTVEMITLLYAVATMKTKKKGHGNNEANESVRDAILDRVGKLSWSIFKTVNPHSNVREEIFKEFAGKGFEWALLLPGVALLSKDMAQFVGDMSAQAAIKAGIVSLFTYYVINLVRRNMPWDAPADGALRNTWVPALFASFGGAAVDKVAVNSMGDALGVSLGLNVIYIPLIMLMSLTIPLNGSQMTRQAFTRWPVFESLFTNMPRILRVFEGMAVALGIPAETIRTWFEDGKFDSAANTILATVIQAFINEPASNRVYGAVDGTKIQEDAIVSMTSEGRKRIGAESQAKDMLRNLLTGGRQWDFWQFVRGENLAAIVYPFTALLTTLLDLRETFPTKPAPVYWNGLFRALSSSIPRRNMEVLLTSILPRMLDAYAPDMIDVYHNWFTILWAARNGIHEKRVRAFFDEHDWIFDQFSIERNLPSLPTSAWYDWHFFASWHRTYLWGGNRDQRPSGKARLASAARNG